MVLCTVEWTMTRVVLYIDNDTQVLPMEQMRRTGCQASRSCGFGDNAWVGMTRLAVPGPLHCLFFKSSLFRVSFFNSVHVRLHRENGEQRAHVFSRRGEGGGLLVHVRKYSVLCQITSIVGLYHPRVNVTLCGSPTFGREDCETVGGIFSG